MRFAAQQVYVTEEGTEVQSRMQLSRHYGVLLCALIKHVLIAIVST